MLDNSGLWHLVVLNSRRKHREHGSTLLRISMTGRSALDPACTLTSVPNRLSTSYPNGYQRKCSDRFRLAKRPRKVGKCKSDWKRTIFTPMMPGTELINRAVVCIKRIAIRQFETLVSPFYVAGSRSFRVVVLAIFEFCTTFRHCMRRCLPE